MFILRLRRFQFAAAGLMLVLGSGCSHEPPVPSATYQITPEEELANAAAREVRAADTWTIETLRQAEPAVMTAREFATLYRDDSPRYDQAVSGKPVQISGHVFNLASTSAELYSKRPDAKGKFLSMLYVADKKAGAPAESRDLDSLTVVPVIVEHDQPWNLTSIGHPVVVRGIATPKGLLEMGLIMEHAGEPVPHYQADALVRETLADSDAMNKNFGTGQIIVQGRVVAIVEEGEGAVPDVSVVVEGDADRHAKLFFGGKNIADFALKGIQPGDNLAVLGSFPTFDSQAEFPFQLSACERFIPQSASTAQSPTTNGAP